jgi:hypothetical protein
VWLGGRSLLSSASLSRGRLLSLRALRSESGKSVSLSLNDLLEDLLSSLNENLGITGALISGTSEGDSLSVSLL